MMVSNLRTVLDDAMSRLGFFHQEYCEANSRYANAKKLIEYLIYRSSRC